MKKIIPILLAMAMVFSTGLLTALANDTPILLDDIQYTLNHTRKTATIIGASYVLLSDDLVIPSEVVYRGTTYTVTGIGQNAFSNRNDLTAITIPATVTTIAKSAFEKALKLETIRFAAGSKLQSIGADCFSDCIVLKSIDLPSTLQNLGKGAFYNCSSLTSLSLPEGLTNIGDFTFCGCDSLASITIPSTVTQIGSRAFFRCTGLKWVTFVPGSQLKKIGYEAFCACSEIAGIILPDGLSSIDSSAFSSCYNLKEVVFSGKDLTFGNNVFDNYNVNLLPATIPVPSDSLATVFYAGTCKDWEQVLENSGSNLTLTHKKLTVVCTNHLQLIAGQAPSVPGTDTPAAPAPIQGQVVTEPAPVPQVVTATEVPAPTKETATPLTPASTQNTAATQTTTPEQSTASTQTNSPDQNTAATQTSSPAQSTTSTQTTAPVQATVVSTPSPAVEVAIVVDPAPPAQVVTSTEVPPATTDIALPLLPSPVEAAVVVEPTPSGQVVAATEVPAPSTGVATPLLPSPIQAAVVVEPTPSTQVVTATEVSTATTEGTTTELPAAPVQAAVVVDSNPDVQFAAALEVAGPAQETAAVLAPAVPVQAAIIVDKLPDVQFATPTDTSAAVQIATKPEALVQAPVQIPVQAPVQTPVKAPVEAPVQAPIADKLPAPLATEATTQTEATPKIPNKHSNLTGAQRFKNDQFSFWYGVVDRITKTSDNATVEVNAGGYHEMPVRVMDVLREHPSTTLMIHWEDNKGPHTLTFPAGKALAPEAGRVSYFLEDLQKAQDGSSSSASAVSNPSTGGPQVTTTSSHWVAAMTVSILFTLALGGIYLSRKSKKNS